MWKMHQEDKTEHKENRMKEKGADSWAENRTSTEDGANEIKESQCLRGDGALIAELAQL